MPATRPCGYCGIALYADESFCPACGTAAPPSRKRGERRSERVAVAMVADSLAEISVCARCRTEVLPGGRYCQMCGAAQPPA